MNKADVKCEFVEITFPVYRYGPPERMSRDTVRRKLMYHMDRPGKISRESGLSQDTKHPNPWPPDQMSYLPGGILDASGLYLPIVGIDAPIEPISGAAKLIFGVLCFPIFFILAYIGVGYNYEYRYSFGEPEQLDLEEFKSRLIKLMYQEKGMPRPIKAIKAATSFYDVMKVEFGADEMEKYYKATLVKNWLNEPKKYPPYSE